MVLKDPNQCKTETDSPLMDTHDSEKEIYPQLSESPNDSMESQVESPVTPVTLESEVLPRDPSTLTRALSPMQEVRRLEQRWQQNIQKLDELLTKFLGNSEKFSQKTFCAAFKDEGVLEIFFYLFDFDDHNQFPQEKLIDTLKFVVKGSGSREWVELVDVVAYVVCGEDNPICVDNFRKIFTSKEVPEKFFKVISSKEDGGLLSKKKIMDLIANLTYARSREGFTKENLDHLEKLFREALDNKQELTFDDFKKIVHSRNPFFAERVFNVFDRDKSGSVSLCEFLDAMHQFTGKSSTDKIQFLFRVYDLDGDGLIQREELEKVMKACMEENGMDFSDEQIEDLTMALFEDADTANRGEITYEDLKAQLERHPGLLENLSISIDRWLAPPQPKQKPGSFIGKIKNVRPYQLTMPYLKNNYVYIIFLLGFIAINIGLFVDRALAVPRNGGVVYDELKKGGGHGFYIVARACGQCLNFNCAFILILVLRRTLTFLRSQGATAFLPLDQHIYFHKLTGFVIVFYSVLHTIMHLINFSAIVVESEVLNAKEFTAIEWLFTAKPGAFGLVPGWANPTGIVLIIVLVIMFICSMPFVRKSGSFEVFYWTHLLYVVFFVCTILHGPHFYKWIIVPGVIFIIEKLHRKVQIQAGYRKTYISSGILLPSKVIHLVIQKPPGFHFHPGDYVFINIPTIAKYEWHPFTLSSAPEQEDAVWLHIRAVGEWTNRLYAYFEKQQRICERASAHMSVVQSETKIIIDARDDPNLQLSIEGTEERERKNGVINKSYEPELAIIHVENETDSSGSDCKDQPKRAKTSPPPDLPRNKKNVGKTFSMPDIKKKMKKRERNLILRDNFRTNSADNMNPPALKQAHTMIDGRSPNIMFPANRSVVQSFRYMRKKPKVVTLDMPEEAVASDNEQGPPEIQPVENAQTDNSAKPTVVRLTSARLFRRRKDSKTMPSREEQDSRRMRRQSRLKEAQAFGQCTVGRPLVIYLDGAYGAPSSHIFRAQHAVLIGTGIGVTPFASILQSIMHRYLKARQTCPNCQHQWASDMNRAVMHLKKVDFFWINRDQRSFEWFVNLLSQLEIEQAEQGGVFERFLDMHMYITSALQRTDMKAVGLQLAMDLLHEKEKRDLITGLKTRTNAGRPNWDKVFKQICNQQKGKVTVFYCGPPALGRILRDKCGAYGFEFRKENF